MTLRHEAAATCLSWIPPTAVQGVFSLPFGLGIAHYDQPPPDELPDVEALLAADAIRFANQLHAWIEVEEGRITSHGMSGQGRLGSTTVRLRSHGLTFAGVALPDLVPPVQVHPDRIVFTQTAGGHTGAPVPRPVTRPPFWRLAAPLAWTSITLTLRADGTSAAQCVEIDAAGVEPGGLLGGDAEECLVVQLSAAQDGQPARRPGAHGDVLFAVGGAHGRVEDRAGADLDGGLPVDLDDQQAVQH
jgi:hypothetical protein